MLERGQHQLLHKINSSTVANSLLQKNVYSTCPPELIFARIIVLYNFPSRKNEKWLSYARPSSPLLLYKAEGGNGGKKWKFSIKLFLYTRVGYTCIHPLNVCVCPPPHSTIANEAKVFHTFIHEQQKKKHYDCRHFI